MVIIIHIEKIKLYFMYLYIVSQKWQEVTIYVVWLKGQLGEVISNIHTVHH